MIARRSGLRGKEDGGVLRIVGYWRDVARGVGSSVTGEDAAVGLWP